MNLILLSLQFLTVIPVRVKGAVSEPQMKGSIVFFPMVGAIQGVVAALALLLSVRIFPPDIAAALVLFSLTATNGGFHLDGLADTVDGASMKSTGDAIRDRRKRLAVMKDSRIGAMGVIAIIFSVLFKFLFLRALILQFARPGFAFLITSLLFLVPVLSRWAMVPVMYHGKAASSEGLGAFFSKATDGRIFFLSSALLAVICFVVLTYVGGTELIRGLTVFFSSVGLLYILGITWVAGCNRRFGGITGDTIGAFSEAAETVVLMIFFLWTGLK